MRQKYPQEVLDKIGAAIRAHRIKEGISQMSLGSQFDAHPSNVSNWEAGRTVPDLGLMVLRAGRAGYPVPWWLVVAYYEAGCRWGAEDSQLEYPVTLLPTGTG